MAERYESAVAAIRRRLDFLEGRIDDQGRSLTALHKQLGELRALLPSNGYQGPTNHHPAVRQVRRPTT